jgi:hypothetical protein
VRKNVKLVGVAADLKRSPTILNLTFMKMEPGGTLWLL